MVLEVMIIPKLLMSIEKKSLCPILKDECEKSFNDGIISGVCSLKPVTSDPVICCPIRLYENDYQILRDVAAISFGKNLDLFSGKNAVLNAKKNEKSCVAVFGKKWGGELRLPQRSGSGGYFVDWVLAELNELGELVEFVAVEVQTIDTTGNYRNGYEEILNNSKSCKNNSRIKLGKCLEKNIASTNL